MILNHCGWVLGVHVSTLVKTRSITQCVFDRFSPFASGHQFRLLNVPLKLHTRILTL